MTLRVPFDGDYSKLILDAVYESREDYKHKGHDPTKMIFRLHESISKGKKSLFGNMSGIRTSADKETKIVNAVMLYNDGSNKQWPDKIDQNVLTYYGDSADGKIDSGLHTKGNKALFRIFNSKHNGNKKRIPPVFIFFKERDQSGINMIFKGLAVPGFIPKKSLKEELILSEKSNEPNFEAKFTILEDVKEINQLWFTDIANGSILDSHHCPTAWHQWINGYI